MYIRNCPKCNKEISYTNKFNVKRADTGKKLCKSCSVKLRNNDPEYSKKISDGRKKYFSEISDEEKAAWIKNNSDAQKAVWEARDNEYMENWKKSVSETTKERWSDEDYRNISIEAMKANPWSANKTDDEIADIMNKTNKTKYDKYGTLFPGGGNKQKKTVIKGLICESSFELKYIESLIDKGEKLPKNADSILTPFGYYTPDFEYEDRFIEIKCEFTYKVLIGEASFSKKTKSLPDQLNKIKWVSENIKRVDIIIFDKKKNN